MNRTQWAVAAAMFLVLLGITFTVLALSYEGRDELVQSQRRGCERGKKDRMANATAWREAEKARRADRDFRVATTYASVASGLESRARIKCESAFPDASFLP